MHGFIISINGKQLVSVSMEELQVFSVQVHGDILGNEFSHIYVSGGNYEDGSEKYLIWADNIEVFPNDEIQIKFLQDISTSHVDKSIEELHPSGENQESPPESLEAMLKELGARPRVREKFTFKVIDPNGQEIASQSDANDFSYGFSVLWNWTTPTIARVSLTSNSLQNIQNREGGAEHSRFKLQFGQEVAFRASA